MSDDYQWHYNFKENFAEILPAKSRNRMFVVSSLIMKCLDKYCSGPCDAAILKVHTYIYDRYRGILKKFVRNLNSPFYHVKSNLLGFILTMTYSPSEKVSNYLTINFEVN
jgi:hypothetical protein